MTDPIEAMARAMRPALFSKPDPVGPIGALLREFRKYRPGDCIPTYHNMCGRRTTYLPCRCRHCRSNRNWPEPMENP